MDKTTQIIRDYYDAGVTSEWNRIADKPEFILTCRMLNRYIKPNDSVLDIGGGPGRYALYFAKKGCHVTLLDLSGESTRFAAERARDMGIPLSVITGDARRADRLVSGLFDHILLMGPLYHILTEEERVKAVEAALNLLKPNGLIYVSFISAMASIIYSMRDDPEDVISASPFIKAYLDRLVRKESYAGEAFTQAVFTQPDEILPFMAKFPLDKCHLFGQEGILSPQEHTIMSSPKDAVNQWLDLAEKLMEREDLLSWSEHIMYIGRKKKLDSY